MEIMYFLSGFVGSSVCPAQSTRCRISRLGTVPRWSAPTRSAARRTFHAVGSSHHRPATHGASGNARTFSRNAARRTRHAPTTPRFQVHSGNAQPAKPGKNGKKIRRKTENKNYLFIYLISIVSLFLNLGLVAFERRGRIWCRWNAASSRRSGPGTFDRVHVGLCRSSGPEANVGRTSVPSHPADVSRHGRKDHRHVVGDRQFGVVAHVGTSRITQSQGTIAIFMLPNLCEMLTLLSCTNGIGGWSRRCTPGSSS